MFMITLGKTGLRRAGIAVLCGALLAGAAAWGRSAFGGKAVSAGAAVPAAIESTQDIQTYFTGYGLETDPAGITADKVKIPKKWDDSFSAFNAVVAQSGLSLEKYKGKTVEKWLAPVPAKSSGTAQTYGVLLVYKNRAVGAYLLEKPSGSVTGLADAVSTMAAADSAAAAAAGADGAASEVSAEPDSSAAQASLDVDLQPGADGYPVE